MALPTEIRRCGPGDEDMLSLLGRASFLEAFAGILPGPDILAHCSRKHSPEIYRNWLSDGDSRIWVAEASLGRAPVGYLVLTAPDLPVPDLTSQDREVKRIYLLHRFQGGGLGRKLMDKALNEARAGGARRLLLGVYERNDSAISFYERLGYQRIGTRAFQVGALVCTDAILSRTV